MPNTITNLIPVIYAAVFQEWLKGMPKVVEFEEIAKKDKAKTKAVTRAEFEAMPPEQKFEFIKSGGTITE